MSSLPVKMKKKKNKKNSSKITTWDLKSPRVLKANIPPFSSEIFLRAKFEVKIARKGHLGACQYLCQFSLPWALIEKI